MFLNWQRQDKYMEDGRGHVAQLPSYDLFTGFIWKISQGQFSKMNMVIEVQGLWFFSSPFNHWFCEEFQLDDISVSKYSLPGNYMHTAPPFVGFCKVGGVQLLIWNVLCLESRIMAYTRWAWSSIVVATQFENVDQVEGWWM